MSNPNEKEIVRIDLTDEQKDQVKAATEQNAEAIELTIPREVASRYEPATTASHRDQIMSDNKENEIVRIDLTNDQKEQVKAATDQSVDAIELTVQELEARIAPRTLLD